MTAAQQKAHDAAYAACDHTIEGRFAKGDLVADYFGRECWKVVTYGIAYHEDVSSRIYGVQPAKGPAGWKQCVQIREAIRTVMERGTNEPGSRAGDSSAQVARPAGEPLASWTDARHNSYATCETLTLYEGGIIGVVSPNYDDSPTVKWLRDEKLQRKIWAAINACPKPITLPAATVKERTTKLTIAKDSPRYAAYLAARGATERDAVISSFDGTELSPSGIDLPMAEYRRIKAELDAAGTST